MLGYLSEMIGSFLARKKELFVSYLTGLHVYRHTCCSNMAKLGMNPKVSQYLKGYSDIKMMFRTYTYLGLEDVADEPSRTRECAPVTQKIIWKKHIGALLKQSIFWCKGK